MQDQPTSFTRDELTLYQYEFCKEELCNLYNDIIIFNNPQFTKLEKDAIVHFVDYCLKRLDIAINCPRSPDGKSFKQRVENEL